MANGKLRVLEDAHQQLGDANTILVNVAALLGRTVGTHERVTIKVMTARTEVSNALAEVSTQLLALRARGEGR